MDMKKECPRCNTEHEKPGIYCSRKCANVRVVSEETKRKTTEALLRWAKENPREKHLTYTCEKCKTSFQSAAYIRNERKKHCEICRRKVKSSSNELMQLSSRTIQKILKRAKIECAMCGWNRTSLDIHHILPRSEGGSDELNNLIALCPNCHRLAHEKQYTSDELKQRYLNSRLTEWRQYYTPNSE
jgi:5-methylcytosine-specific restriction endonuclease McrA